MLGKEVLISPKNLTRFSGNSSEMDAPLSKHVNDFENIKKLKIIIIYLYLFN
jgi:hypothetical protein